MEVGNSYKSSRQTSKTVSFKLCSYILLRCRLKIFNFRKKINIFEIDSTDCPKKLISKGVGITAEGLEKFRKFNKRGAGGCLFGTEEYCAIVVTRLSMSTWGLGYRQTC